MRHIRLLTLAFAAVLTLTLGGCASRAPAAPEALSPEPVAEKGHDCGRCGRVRLIQVIDSHPAAVAPTGGLLGGANADLILGSRLAGAAGTTERITINMDIGGIEALELPSPSGLREGDRVRLRGSSVELLSDTY